MSIVPLRPLSDLAKARIPKRFWAATFDTYEPKTDSQRAGARAARWWLDKGRHEGGMLALIGKQGTGKSHLLYAVAHEILAKQGAAFIRPWYAFADELRFGISVSTEGGYREKKPGEVRADWWGAPVVLLDEVRATAGTSFDDTELARYACHAYDHGKAVLMTTNVHPLANVLGDAAASRFRQVVIDGPDHRQAAA